MKKIIDQNLYDTDTAEAIHSFVPEEGVLETLYISPNEQLFVVVETNEPDHDTLSLLDIDNARDKVVEWLEKSDAPESVYDELEMEVEEG